MAASVPIERRKHVSACEEVAVLCAVCCVLCVCVRARACAAVRVMRARVHHGRHARVRARYGVCAMSPA